MTGKSRKIVLLPDLKRLNAKRKKLPIFRPHDLSSMVKKTEGSIEAIEVDEALVLELRRSSRLTHSESGACVPLVSATGGVAVALAC